MGYLFIAISVLSGAAKGYCGKMTSGYVEKYNDAMFINIIRMSICVIIGFLMLLAQGNVGFLAVDAKTLAITALSGVTTSLFVVCWLLSVKRGAYMMLDVFLMMGVIVTLLCSKFTFGEEIKGTQWIGLAILLAAVLIMCSYNNSIKQKMTPISLALLIAAGVANGLTDFSQKLYVHYGVNDNAAVFNFYTYVFSALTLGLFYLIFKFNNREKGHEGEVLKKIFLYVLVMSVCLFLNSFFKTKAAALLPATQVYPLFQGCALMLSSIMSAVFFKEKLTPKCIIGLIMAFVALLIINLL